jgi:hypothetical protein
MQTRSVIVWIVAMALVFEPFGLAETGHFTHPDNPSGVGEWIFPSPYDPAYPFPFYLPEESKSDVLTRLREAGGLDTVDERLRRALSFHDPKLGLYPFLASVPAGGKDAGGTGPGNPSQKQLWMAKPYGDWVLGGEFYQGPKRVFMGKLQALYQNAKQSLVIILGHLQDSGRLAEFGGFDRSGRFVPSSQLPTPLQGAVKTYMESLLEMHELIQTLLFLPAEHVDPDVALDFLNAQGLGPLVRFDGSQESVLKESLQRFCSSSFLYHHLSAIRLQEGEGGKAYLAGHSDPRTVRAFTHAYYLEDAKGANGGETLDQRKQAYKAWFDRLRPSNAPELSPRNIEALVGVAKSHVRVPRFLLKARNAMEYFVELQTLWVPITLDAEKKPVIPDHFKTVLARQMDTLSWAMKPQPNLVDEATQVSWKTQHHQPILWSSLGFPASGTVDPFFDLIKHRPTEFLRAQDQALMLSGLYASPGSGLPTYQIRESESESERRPDGFWLDDTENPRFFVEWRVPQMVCGAVYERNLVAGAWSTQATLRPGGPMPGQPLGALDQLQQRAHPWMKVWKTSDLVSLGLSVFTGQSFVGQPAESLSRKRDEISDRHRDFVRSRFTLPTRSMRPWSIYEWYYLRGLIPSTAVGPQWRISQAFEVSPMTAGGDLIPQLAVRSGFLEDFVRSKQEPSLWNSPGGLHLMPAQGVDTQPLFRSDMTQYLRSFASARVRNRLMPYEVQQITVGGKRLPMKDLETMAGQMVQSLHRSRVLFTAQELRRMLRSYFQDLLLPLAVIEQYASSEVVSGVGENARTIAAMKRFFLNAGTIHYELIELIEDSDDTYLISTGPGALQTHALDSMQNFSASGLQGGKSEDETLTLTRSGYVISFREPFAEIQKKSLTFPEWSLSDDLEHQLRRFKHSLDKRNLWCRELTPSFRKELVQSMVKALPESLQAVAKSLPDEALHGMVCALPTLIGQELDFYQWVVKNELQFQVLKDYFTAFKPHQNEDRRLNKLLHHVTLPSIAFSGIWSTEGIVTQNLKTAIQDHETFMDLYMGYQQDQGWFTQAPEAIRRMFPRAAQGEPVSSPDWTFHPPTRMEFGRLNATGREWVLAVDDVAIADPGQFDESCNYVGAPNVMSVYVDPKPALELKLMCLFKRVQRAVMFLTQSSPYQAIVSDYQARLATWAKTPQLSFRDLLTQSAYPSLIHRLKSEVKFPESLDPNLRACEQQKIQLTPAGVQSLSEGPLSVVHTSVHQGIQQMLAQTVGSTLENALVNACQASQNRDLKLGQLIALWQTVAYLLQPLQTDTTRFHSGLWFGEDSVYQQFGGDDSLAQQAGGLYRAWSRYVTMVQLARSQDRSVIWQKTNEENPAALKTHYLNLRAELTMAFRELKIESLVNSLVGVKSTLAYGDKRREIQEMGVALPSDRRYAQEVSVVGDVGHFHFEIPSPAAGKKLIDWEFSYNRNTGIGNAIDTGLSLLGSGTPDPVGVHYQLERSNSWLSSLSHSLDQSICRRVTQTFQVAPIATLSGGSSILETFSLADEVSQRGLRVSILGSSRETRSYVPGSYFCDLKYARPGGGSEFGSLTVRELNAVEDGNAMIGYLKGLNGKDADAHDKARFQLDQLMAQAVVARVFLDKVHTHILQPYLLAARAFEDLFQGLREILQSSSHHTSQKLAQAVFGKLYAFSNSDEGRYLLSKFFLRQSFVSMVKDLFPSGDLVLDLAAPVFRASMLGKLQRWYGEPASMQRVEAEFTRQALEKRSDPGKSLDPGEKLALKRQAVQASLMGRIRQTIEVTEAFLGAHTDQLRTAFPLLSLPTLENVDGSDVSTDSDHPPKVYQQLFASPLFEPYRPMNDALLIPKEAAGEVSRSNQNIQVLMSEGTFYDRHMDVLDFALYQWTRDYPYDPAHLFLATGIVDNEHPIPDKIRVELTDLPQEASGKIEFEGENRSGLFSVQREDPENDASAILSFGWENRDKLDPAKPYDRWYPSSDLPETRRAQLAQEVHTSFVQWVKGHSFPWLTPELRPSSGSFDLPAFLGFGPGSSQNPKSFAQPLADFLSAVASQQQGRAGEEGTDYFGLYVADEHTWGLISKVRLSESREERKGWANLLDSHFRKQEKDILDQIELTLRTHPGGGSLGTNGSKMDPLLQEKILNELFSNEAAVSAIEERYGDRFAELKAEFVPHKVYMYLAGQAAYQSVMAEIARWFFAAMVVSLIVPVVTSVAGTFGRLAAHGVGRGVLAQTVGFGFRFLSLSGKLSGSVLGVYAALNLIPIFNFGFLESMAILATLALASSVKGLIRARVSTVVNQAAMSEARRQWVWGVIRRLTHLGGRAKHFLLYVVLMDMVAMWLDWQVTHDTASAYAAYSALFYTYFQMPNSIRDLQGISPSSNEKHVRLVSDFKYLDYLYETRTRMFSMAVLGSTLALGFNTWALHGLTSGRGLKNVTEGMPPELKQMLDNLGRRVTRRTLWSFLGLGGRAPRVSGAQQVDPFEALKRQNPEQYRNLLIRLYPIRNSLEVYFRDHPSWAQLKVDRMISDLAKDMEAFRIQVIDESIGLKELYSRDLRQISRIDRLLLGLEPSSLRIQPFSNSQELLRTSASHKAKALEMLWGHGTTQWLKRGDLGEADLSALHREIGETYVSTPRILRTLTDSSLQRYRQMMLDNPKLLMHVVNSICAKVLAKTQSVSRMLVVRAEMLGLINRKLGYLFSQDAEGWIRLIGPEDVKDIQQHLRDGNPWVDDFMSLLRQPESLHAFRTEIQKLGFDLEFASIAHMDVPGIRSLWNTSDDALGHGPYLRFEPLSPGTARDRWRESVYSGGEWPPLNLGRVR